ncbi:MAG: hypothetical protein EOP58_10890 [Sphingomonadales bacterium]|nr:MAG: hypothetical protein EOP58_10890 [Sphingomonadales bacterium]
MFAIQKIYDAAFDERQFPELLQGVGAYLGGQSGYLTWSNSVNEARFEAQYGNDPAFLQQYIETYWEHDTLRPVLYAQPEGEPISVYALLQQPDVRASRFYREYLAPQHIVDNLAVNLIKRDNMIATIAILRLGDAPPFDAADIAQMRELVPHLRRAVFLSSYRIRQANLIDAYRQTAHGARDGLVLLDEDGHVLDLGPEVERLSGLSSAAMATRSALGKTLARAMRVGEPVLHDLETNGGTVRLLLQSQTLVRNRFGDLVEGPGAAHAVSVTVLDRRWGLAYASIAAAHKLTPGEARVLEDVLTHGEMTGTPERLGMARATSRSHLHRIYAKTGTKGFSDLCLFAHRFIVPRS